MNAPEISVIVPVYNTSEYLEQCILSIIGQTFENLELICVDDGSTDGSLELLERFAEQDARVRVIHREKPSGSAARPRNVGLSKAMGKYVIFLDSDDYFDCRMFEKMYCCAEEWNADLVMCDCCIINSTVKTHKEVLHHKYIPEMDVFSYKDIQDTIFQISDADIWHRLILRDLLVRYQLMFQENTSVLDDIFFVNLLQVLSGRIHILDEKLVYYREARPGGQTSAIARHKESIYAAFDQLNQYLIRAGLYHQVEKSLQNWILDTLVWWYYGAHNPEIEGELFFLYRNCYFKALGLMGMKVEDIYHNREFYQFILHQEFKPSIHPRLMAKNVRLFSLAAHFEEIFPNGADFVLYGAGEVGRGVYQFLGHEKKHTVKLWCDRNPYKTGNSAVRLPEEIRNIEYDAVLIAIADEKIVLEVKAYLQTMGVDEKKIYAV